MILDDFRLKTDDERVFELTIAQARSAAIQMIGISRKSSGAVKRFLKDRDYSTEVIELVIQGLIEDRYLDDLRMAQTKIKARTGAKAESKARTAQRLNQLGLDREAITSTLSDLPDDRDFALQALSAKFNRHFQAGFDAVSPELTFKMRRFLMSRGFSTEVTRDTIRTYLKGRLFEDDDS
ncbi:MAG: regulatory protein RecX [Eubacteriales bacterium]|nr:regulatory protein RecX [Eubacteriales bacterium]